MSYMCSIERLFAPSNDIEEQGSLERTKSSKTIENRLTSPTEAIMSSIAFDHSSRHLSSRPVRHLVAVPDLEATPTVRLTRRGKLTVLAAAVAILAVLVVMFGSSSLAGDQPGVLPQTTSVTVLPGNTLWEIAADANPNGDIRSTVDDILRLNSLPNASALQMGSEIAVPVYK